MNSFTKKMLCLLLVVFLAMPMSVYAAGGTFGITASTPTVDPGTQFTVNVGGDCCGRVDLTVKNGTLSESKIWVEEGMTAVTVTAGESGIVTVTAVPYEGFSDLDAELYNPGTKSVTVKINEPVVEDPEKPEKPEKPEADKEEKPEEPEEEKEPVHPEKPEEPEEEKEPVKPEKPEEPEEEKEPAKPEKPEKEPAKNDCIMHWIVLVAAIAGAVIEFITNGNKKAGLVTVAVYTVIAAILAIMGSCSLDWIIAIAGAAVIAVEYLALNKKETEE